MRDRLPNRRQQETVTVGKHHISLGFYPDGRVGEVFASGEKPGSESDHLLADACTVISVALQHGVDAGELAKSLARDPDGQAATIIGAVVEACRAG